MMTLNDGRSELWQWDTGRKLTVDAECSQVHFSNKVFGRSIDVDVVGGVVEIPDVLLQTDKDLTAWAFVGTAEDGYTKISKTFKVNRRNKPADYVFTPVEQMTIDEIATIAQSVRDDADAGLFKGEDGVSCTHAWNGTTLSITSASGTSSANLKGDKGDKGGKGDPFTYEDFTEEQLAGLKGEKGDKGDTGAPGVQGEKGETGEQGIQGIQGVQGEKGEKGDAGAKGDKGDPYTLTDADRQSIADAVFNNLVKEQWVFELSDGTIVTRDVVVG